MTVIPIIIGALGVILGKETEENGDQKKKTRPSRGQHR